MSSAAARAGGRCPRRTPGALLVLLVLQQGSWCRADDGNSTSSSLLPAELEGKPLIEQLLARKAALAQHLRSDAWAW